MKTGIAQSVVWLLWKHKKHRFNLQNAFKNKSGMVACQKTGASLEVPGQPAYPT